jgi:hypothetical protein
MGLAPRAPLLECGRERPRTRIIKTKCFVDHLNQMVHGEWFQHDNNDSRPFVFRGWLGDLNCLE